MTLRGEKGFSRIVIAISSGSIAIGMAVMIVSIAILFGFKDNIRAKILSFSGHMEITRFTIGDNYQNEPISLESSIVREGSLVRGVDYLQPFIYKAAMIKNEQLSKGVLFKGVDQSFNRGAFADNLLEGSLIDFNDSSYSQEILISQKLSEMLSLGLNDEAVFFFIQTPVRIRKLKIKGIYQTGLEGFDENIVIGDLGLARRLNNWEDTAIGGVEVFLKNFDDIDRVEEEIFDLMDYSMQLEVVSGKFPQLFEWLKLLDRNVLMIIGIILVVASFNMVSSLIVLIMEKTNSIGTLKAIGARNAQVQSIFFSIGFRILLFGILYGNGIGLGFCVIQHFFHVIPLDPVNYYMDAVPISFEWGLFGLINILTVLVVAACLYLPTFIIGRMSPIAAIRFS